MKNAFISLGPACCIKYQIDNYLSKYASDEISQKFEPQPTHFFDWLLSSDFSVCKVILNYIQDPECNFLKDYTSGPSCTTENSIVRFINYTQLISIHDLPRNPTQTQKKEFVDKFKRRLVRLFDTIKRKDLHIYFIRKNYLNKNYCQEFCDILYKINPENKHTIVSLSETQNTQISSYKNNKIIYIQLMDYIKSEEEWCNKPEWHKPKYKWPLIFNKIYQMSK
jgi:hypothetical protein